MLHSVLLVAAIAFFAPPPATEPPLMTEPITCSSSSCCPGANLTLAVTPIGSTTVQIQMCWQFMPPGGFYQDCTIGSTSTGDMRPKDHESGDCIAIIAALLREDLG